MKRAILFAAVLGLGIASSAQAVIVNWAATTSGQTYDSARLVYVSGGSFSPSYETVATASGGALMSGGAGVYEQNSTDADGRSGGTYYVVLFNGANEVYRSTAGLADSDGSAITFDVMSPASGVFAPADWTPIPEPASGALFCIGAGILAWRRRKRK
jgi:hypothetical protein